MMHAADMTGLSDAVQRLQRRRRYNRRMLALAIALLIALAAAPWV